MKTYRREVLSLVCIFLIVLGTTVGVCAPDLNAQEKGAGKVVFTGDSVDIDTENKIITYRGDVKVVQGSTTMFSDVMAISLDESGKQVKQAVATGNVRLVNETITATGGEGTFYNQEQKIVLTEQAKVWQGNNAISAARIVAYLRQEVLEGYSSSDERATMTIYSSGELDMPFGNTAEPTETGTQEEEESLSPDSSSVSAETSDTPETSAENVSPVTIEAESLRLDNSLQQASFSGNVVAVKDVTQLYADDMLVYITELPEGGNDVERIEIFGNVKIVNETQTVTGDKGFFWNQEQRARIEGDSGKKARIEDTAQNLVLEAPVVKIDLATNQVTAEKVTPITAEEQPEGGSERIRMEFGTDETQSIFGAEAPEEEEEERFIVTEKTLEMLEEADVPDEVLEDLTLLQDREFQGEDAFMEGLEKGIGVDYTDKYKKLLLKYSKVEELVDEKDLPSVTIQPDNIGDSQE